MRQKKAPVFVWPSGAIVTIRPNGSDEIWIKDERGHGIAIRPGVGPHGLGLQLRHFVGTAPLTVGGNLSGREATPKSCGDFWQLEVTQYGQDDAAQDFKERYNRGGKL